MRGSVTDHDLPVWAQRVALRGNVAIVVGVSGGTQVRGVPVSAKALVADILDVIGRGEAAGLDDGRHVNGRRGVGP